MRPLWPGEAGHHGPEVKLVDLGELGVLGCIVEVPANQSINYSIYLINKSIQQLVGLRELRVLRCVVEVPANLSINQSISQSIN